MLVTQQPLPAAEERTPAFLSSSVGRKVVMALTGIILFGFVTAHMLGNLQVYAGRETLNHYAEFLQTMGHGGGIWIARAVLLVSVVLHVWSATTLTLDNRKARPVAYRVAKSRAATWGSRTMRWSGVILAVFIVYHLLHLTVGVVHPSFVKGDVYHNVVAGFQVPAAAAFYIVAQLCLGLHLWHGVWSVTQTLGWAHPSYAAIRRTFAASLAFVVVGANVSYPLAVLTGIVH